MFNCSSILKKVWSFEKVPCCESSKVFSSSVPQSQNNKTVNHIQVTSCWHLSAKVQADISKNVRPSLESGSLLGELQSLLSPFYLSSAQFSSRGSSTERWRGRWYLLVFSTNVSGKEWRLGSEENSYLIFRIICCPGAPCGLAAACNRPPGTLWGEEREKYCRNIFY